MLRTWSRITILNNYSPTEVVLRRKVARLTTRFYTFPPHILFKRRQGTRQFYPTEFIKWVPKPGPTRFYCTYKHRLEHYGRPFVSKLWHDIRAVFSHVYLQSFLLHDIRAFFCHVYLRFIPKYMTLFLQTRIYMRYKQACGIWGHRKSSYKRHRIIPSAKNPFMYDGAEK